MPPHLRQDREPLCHPALPAREKRPSGFWRACAAPSLALFLLFAAHIAPAQTAGQFFDSGAQLYISNNIPSALDRVEAGRKLYPDDVKLKKLEELLKQQQQSQSQQNQQQQNQQNQQSQSKQQQQKNRQSQSQQSQSQQNQQQNKQNQQQQSQSGQQNQQQQNQSAGQQNQSQSPQNGQMTPEEARQLLDSQKAGEQVLQFAPRGKPENQKQPVKDW